MVRIHNLKKRFCGLIFHVYDNNAMPGSDVWHDKFHRRQAGGHRIATYLRKQDWDIEVIDFSAKFSFEELKEIAKSRITKDTCFCSFGCIFGSWPTHIEQFAVWLKETYPNIVITYGGTIWPYVKSKAIDYYITGYAELAMLNLLEVLVGNKTKSSLKFDLRFADRKVITANKSNPAFPLNILSIDYEDRDFIQPEEWLHVELSRGCVFKCKFCNYPVLNVKGDYTQDADDFYRNMQSNFDRFGIKNYYVVDETFNDRPDKISKFADAVERLSFTPFYSGFIRADLLVSRPQDREDLLRMNFLGHHYGIESLHYPSAKEIGKGMHPDTLTQGLLDVKKYFLSNNRKIYRGTMSFIAGLPHETVQTMMQSIEWLKNNWSDQSTIWFPLSLPDPEQVSHGWADSVSDLAVDFEKFGYIKDDTVDTSNHNGELPWKNEHVSYKKMQVFVEKLVPKLIGHITNNISSLTLDELTYPGRTIDQGLQEKFLQHNLDRSLQFRNFVVENYKHKKLSI